MMFQPKNLSTPEGIRDAMPGGYGPLLESMTPFDVNTIRRVIKNYNHKHRAWPVIWAMAEGGEIAAREVAAKLGWLNQAA